MGCPPSQHYSPVEVKKVSPTKQLRSVQNPGYFLYIGDYTTHIWDYDKACYKDTYEPTRTLECHKGIERCSIKDCDDTCGHSSILSLCEGQHSTPGHLDPRQDEDDDEGTERVRVESGEMPANRVGNVPPSIFFPCNKQLSTIN